MIVHNPFGPIFEKELRATSRRKRTYALRSAYLGGLLLFLVFAYVENASWRDAGNSVTMRVQQQNRLGQTFFLSFSLFCVGAMAMIGPVLTCTAISAERLHKTLHVLLMTPITAWQIVTGKLFSRLLVALTLIGLSLPVLALVRLLGGVEMSQMFGVIALATATALVTAALGLFLSTFVNRAYAAILLAYGTILAAWVFLPIFTVAMTATRGPPPWHVLKVACTVSPFLCTLALVAPGFAPGTGPWPACVAVQLGLSAALVTCCALVLRRIQRREGSASQAEAVPLPAPAPEPGAPGPDGAAAPRPFAPAHWKARGRSDVGDNPVLWRELGRPLFAKRWHARAALALVVALMIFSYVSLAANRALDDREFQIGYAFVFNGVAWLVLAVLSGTAIAQEKESDTWTLLLATPVPGRAIVLGKVLGIYRRVLWPFVLVAAHFALFALFRVISWTTALVVLWVMFSFNTVWVATGLYLSLKVRKVTFAVIVNLMIAVVLYVGSAVVLGIIAELLRPRGGDAWPELFIWGLPYFHLAMGVEEFRPDFLWTEMFYAPGLHRMPVTGLLWGGLLFGALHILASGTILFFTLNRFNRIVGRAEQARPLPAERLPVTTSPAAV